MGASGTLPDPGGDQRRRKVAEAGHTGDVETARNALTDPDPSLRALALGAAHRLEALTDGDLVEALRDESAAVRRRAAEIAAGHPAVSLLGPLDDGDPSVVEQAAWACGERHEHEAGVVEALSRLAGSHQDPLVREAAVAALGAIGDLSGLPAVLAAATDKPAVRRRAVIALASFDGPEVDAALNRALTDRDWQVRQAAEDLLDVPPTGAG